MSPDARHLEFPFADGYKYPKCTVKESLCVPTLSRKQKKNETSSTPNELKLHEQLDMESIDGLVTEDLEWTLEDMDEDGLDGRLITGKADKSLFLSHSTSIDDFDYRPESIPWEDLPPYLRIPEQDIDKEGEGPNTNLVDDMAAAKETMHETTWHLFNDTTHVVKHPDAQFFEATKSKRKVDVNTELEKLLQVGPYSSSNPIISRVALYMEPIIEGSRAFLCVFRAGFNIYTWRDPVLSFWFFLFGLALVVILFILPWRLVLGVVGLLVVGPQVRPVCDYLF
jgi:hypothetical protein